MRGWQKITVAVLAMSVLSACGGRKQVDPGPDEFAVLPSKPLQSPTSMTVLPQPTPGGSNITDATPIPDALAALR